MPTPDQLRIIGPEAQYKAITQQVLQNLFPKGIKPLSVFDSEQAVKIPLSNLDVYQVIGAFKPLVVVIPRGGIEGGKVFVNPDSESTRIIFSVQMPKRLMSVVAEFGRMAMENKYVSRLIVYPSYFSVPHYATLNGTGDMEKGSVVPVTEQGQLVNQFITDPARVLLHIALIGEEAMLPNQMELIHGLVVLK